MAELQQAGQQRQIQIKITDEAMAGAASNMMSVTHTKEEFVLDFMNVYPAQGQGIVTSRVIVTPGHMKRIAKAVQENVERYEKQFGVIDEVQPQQDTIGFKTV